MKGLRQQTGKTVEQAKAAFQNHSGGWGLPHLWLTHTLPVSSAHDRNRTVLGLLPLSLVYAASFNLPYPPQACKRPPLSVFPESQQWAFHSHWDVIQAGSWSLASEPDSVSVPLWLLLIAFCHRTDSPQTADGLRHVFACIPATISLSLPSPPLPLSSSLLEMSWLSLSPHGPLSSSFTLFYPH